MVRIMACAVQLSNAPCEIACGTVDGGGALGVFVSTHPRSVRRHAIALCRSLYRLSSLCQKNAQSAGLGCSPAGRGTTWVEQKAHTCLESTRRTGVVRDSARPADRGDARAAVARARLPYRGVTPHPSWADTLKAGDDLIRRCMSTGRPAGGARGRVSNP